MKWFRAKTILCLAGLVVGGCGMEAGQERTGPAVTENAILRVYVLRHGEAYKNVPHAEDTPKEKLDSLTPRGLRQAALAGKFLKDKGIVAVIASPTGRTRQTAEAISQAIGLKKAPIEDKSFASITQGTTPEGEPVTWSWREKQWAAGRDPRPEGGESFADGIARAVDAVNRLAKEYPGRAVAIVSHGDICAGLLGQASHTPIPERYLGHAVPTGSVSEIVITDAGWVLRSEGVTL